VLAYLDHAASGPLHPDAAAAMRPWLAERFGNPSGVHQVARAARAAVDDARDVLGDLLSVAPGEVVFTSGGTEADNLAVLGASAARPGPIVISGVEHPAVVESALASGCEVRVVPVDFDGVVDPAALRTLLDAQVVLVSVQLANQETGVIQPFDEVSRVVRRFAPNALLHTDAVQAFAWMDVGSVAGSADMLSVSGHKLGGPQGIGALATRGRPLLRPVVHGGGQERELRSGTHNVAGIVGLAAAASAAARERERTAAAVTALRDRLSAYVRSGIGDAVETAYRAEKLPGHLHLRFPGVESESLLVLLDEAGVCASAGAACASGALDPSPVLLAMGIAKEDALSSLRLTIGATTTEDEVDFAGRAVVDAVDRLRRS
jgi:cysteine desulfurase